MLFYQSQTERVSQQKVQEHYGIKAIHGVNTSKKRIKEIRNGKKEGWERDVKACEIWDESFSNTHVCCRVLRLLLPTASNPGKEGAAGILAEPTLGMTSETDDMGANSWTHVLTR